MRPCTRLLGSAVFLVSLGLQPGLAQTMRPVAQSSGGQVSSSSGVAIEAGAGRVLQTSRPIANLFAADPKIAEVRPASPTSVFIFGVAPGRTTIAALDQAGGVIAQYDVTVRPSSYAARDASQQLQQALPGSRLAVQTSANGLALSGQVGRAGDAEQAASIVRGYLGDKQKLDNRLMVQGPLQVNLRVRIAEISRDVTRRFGINWSAMGSFGKYGVIGAAVTDVFNTAASPASTISSGYASKSLSVSAVLDLLAADNLATILAEPNLTAMSGETASFLAGGEYPIPVAQQNNTITIEYKQYGVSLAFVPTVVGGDHINLRVRPEVSQLSQTGAVQLGAGNGTISVPALTVRRADTTVELGSGESFAIAGLIQAQNTTGANGLPFAGDIPVLGALFRSSNFQRNETELVIIVTPYIVRPASSPDQLRTPLDNYTPPNDVDRVLYNRQIGRPAVPEAPPAPMPAPMPAPLPAPRADVQAAVVRETPADAARPMPAVVAVPPPAPMPVTPMPVSAPMAVMPMRYSSRETFAVNLPAGAGFALK